MTTPSHDGHVDLDSLAELDGELLDAQRAAAVRAHVDGCSQCAERLGAVRSTRALLSTLPSVSMPADVAARVDEAVTNAGAAPLASTVVPIGPRRRWWRSPAVAGAAAVAAVVVLVAALVVGKIGHSSNTNSNAASGSVATRPHADTQLAETAAIKEWATGTDYTSATIPTLVPRLVTGTPPATLPASRSDLAPASPSVATAGPSAGPTITFDQMRSARSAVAECGHILAGDSTTVPLAVDFARYKGSTAVVVVLPAPGHASQVDVFVLQSSCSGSELFPFFRISR